VHEIKIMLATWKICRLRKKMKSVDSMVIRRINIICLQESKWACEKCRHENTDMESGIQKKRGI